jgi:lipopolysaccharide biosynthesis regulator YciM
MFREIVDSFIPPMMKQLAPHTVRESRRLMKDKSENPIMEKARQYAKNGMYDRALELYLEAWDSSRNPAAGFNGAIMYEVTGDIDAAVSLMEEVVDRHPEKKIIREYNRLLGVREEQAMVAEQLA